MNRSTATDTGVRDFLTNSAFDMRYSIAVTLVRMRPYEKLGARKLMMSTPNPENPMVVVQNPKSCPSTLRSRHSGTAARLPLIGLVALWMVSAFAAGCSESETGGGGYAHDTSSDSTVADVGLGDISGVDTGVPSDVGNQGDCPGGKGCGVECKNAADCDDADECTTDICGIDGICVHTAISPCQAECTVDQDCDDQDPCTQDVCGATQNCTNSPIAGCGEPECTTDGDCIDTNPCTDDVCSDDFLCVFEPNTQPCDDGDECTEGEVCGLGQCSGGIPLATPECTVKPPTCDAICQLFGAEGTEAVCVFKMAADTQGAPRGTALQFVAAYDSDRVQFIHFFDEHCFGDAGCFDVPTNGPNSLTLSTGHSVAIAPDSPEKWAGDGAVILVNLADPTLPLSRAYLTGPTTVEEDPVFMQGRFKLLVSINKSEAVDVCLSKLLAADGSAISLPTVIQNFLIVTSTPKQ